MSTADPIPINGSQADLIAWRERAIARIDAVRLEAEAQAGPEEVAAVDARNRARPRPNLEKLTDAQNYYRDTLDLNGTVEILIAADFPVDCWNGADIATMIGVEKT